jgi:hypothetical protein
LSQEVNSTGSPTTSQLERKETLYMTYSAPEILATVDTAEVLAAAHGGGGSSSSN